jgi:DNA repair protein RadC
MTNQKPVNEKVEDETIATALSIIERRLKTGEVYPIHEALKNFLRFQAEGLAQETFAVLYLDRKLKLIEYEQRLARPDSPVTAHPREIVKRALIKDAAFVVLHHNHPSGSCWPSFSDYQQAVELRDALDLFDVPVLDHVITSDEGLFSMAERGFG